MRQFLFLIAIVCPLVLLAELPPSAYESRQKSAAESLNIEVLRVEIEPGDAPARQNVRVMALVNKVARTSTGLQEGGLINILYTVTAREKGWAGPGEIPILEEKDKTLAYLVKDATSGEYHPAAGAMSFRNF
ncbi:MAG: hypothetical protein WCQ16_03340 [Verrucomicrobiae bacterium]